MKEKEIPLIEILTPLTGDFYPDEHSKEEGQEEWNPLDGSDLVQYESDITRVLERYNRFELDDESCNMMIFFDGSQSVQDKVKSAVISVKNVEGVLYGCTTLKLKESLEAPELEEMCEYITGQYADGWGEGFEQGEIAVDGGTLYVHFWQSQDYKMHKREVPKEEQQAPVEKRGKRPKLKLVGHDGNIFSILSDARWLLCKEGQEEKADEMIGRVKKSKNYYTALNIISEYVETELSGPEESTERKKDKEKGDRSR